MSCGGTGSCTCGGGSSKEQAIAAINGIALHEASEQLTPEDLRERAWAELLRQEAVRQGRLPPHRELNSPGISAGDEAVIQAMLDEAVPLRRTEQRAVVLQLERLMAYPMVKRRVEGGKLTLHGWHYVIEDGEIHVFDAQQGDFLPASVASNPGTGPYRKYVEHDGQILCD